MIDSSRFHPWVYLAYELSTLDMASLHSFVGGLVKALEHIWLSFWFLVGKSIGISGILKW